MARNFRFYEKKRGHRRTGSRIVGSAGEALFFAVLLVLGCAGLIGVFLAMIVPEWRANREFVEHTCVVLGRRVVTVHDRNNAELYRPEIHIQYQIGQPIYQCWTYDIHHSELASREQAEAIVDAFTEGQTYTCWYDPAELNTAVLVRGYRWWVWLVLLVPLSFIIIGGGGLIYAVVHWGRSAECRAASSRRAQPLEMFEAKGRPARLPAIPDCSEIISSPGTKLAFRLPMSISPAWALFGLLAACLLWNGAVSVFLVMAVRGFLQGHPDWLLTIFVLPFAAIGALLAAVFIRLLVLTTGIGPTLVEISNHPLLPGGEYRLFVAQSGHMKMHCFELWLVCVEAATYTQGTNTRTEVREVHRQSLLRREEFEVRRGMPFESECELCVPSHAMHSFHARHNEVNWKIVARGDVERWPGYERSFSVVVNPGASRTER